MVKNYLIQIVLFVALIFSSCSKDVITNPGTTGTSSLSQGSVSLRMDKNTAPNNAVKVVAYLYLTNYDTLSETMNLINDTSANILFQSVPAGNWHLEVNVLDSMQTVIYTGKTDVNILAGITTQVSLTLVPTGQGTGGIEITVNWGQNSSAWVDYQGNPIFTVADNPSYPNAVSTAKIIYDNGMYKMWYFCTYNAGKGNIWYADSKDGIHWQSPYSQAVFTNGNSGAWDDYTVVPNSIIKEDSVYLLYYVGWQSQYGQRQIGLATSTDGINWERYPNPVIKADSLDNYQVAGCSVLNVNGKFYMYYDTTPLDNYNNKKINVAFSSDGIKWTNYSGNPILTASEPWESIGILAASVIYDNGQFVMIYSSSDRTKFGIAFSKDGVNWNKSPNPAFTLDNTNQKYSQINYPFLMKAGNEYRLYYTATSSNNGIELCLTQNLNLD